MRIGEWLWYDQKPTMGLVGDHDAAASISLSSRVVNSITATLLPAAALAEAINGGAYGAVSGL